MKKLWYVLPITILFATPWIHKISYDNILLAIPDFDHAGAHFLAICLSLGAIIASAVIIIEVKS